MPQIVSCPDCDRKLKVPDNLLGKNVKCPGCGQKFLAESRDEPDDDADAAPSTGVSARRGESRRDEEEDDRPKSRRRPIEVDEDDDYPAERREREDDRGPVVSKADVRQGWERVRFGVNLILMGVWVLVAAVVVWVTGGTLVVLTGAASIGSLGAVWGPGGPVTQQQANQAAGQVAGTACATMAGVLVVYGLSALLLLGYQALSITGKGFFMGIAPTRKTAYLKWLAVAAFCLSIAWFILPPLFASVQYALIEARIGGCVIFSGYGLTALVALSEFICFFLFLRGVAAALKKHDLAQNIVYYMIAVPVFVLMTCGMAVLLPILGGVALFGATASSLGSHNASTAAGNFAGTGAAFAAGGILCGALIALIGLGLFVWFVVLLYQVRAALDGWLDRN